MTVKWEDGPITQAGRDGHMIIFDEAVAYGSQAAQRARSSRATPVRDYTVLLLDRPARLAIIVSLLGLLVLGYLLGWQGARATEQPSAPAPAVTYEDGSTDEGCADAAALCAETLPYDPTTEEDTDYEFMCRQYGEYCERLRV